MRIQVEPVQIGTEWLMIELQGVLETRTTDTADTAHGGLDLGSFQFKDSDNVEAVIGSHLLAGKLVKVSPPFAVLKKISGSEPHGGMRARDQDDADDSCAQPSTRYDIVAVIRRKIIFKLRPKPLISDENRGLATVARK